MNVGPVIPKQTLHQVNQRMTSLAILSKLIVCNMRLALIVYSMRLASFCIGHTY